MIQYLIYQTFRVESSINFRTVELSWAKTRRMKSLMRTYCGVGRKALSDLNDDWEHLHWCGVWSYEIRPQRIRLSRGRTIPALITIPRARSRRLMFGESTRGRKFAISLFLLRHVWASRRDRQGTRFMHANEVTHYYEWETKLEPIRSVWKSYRNKRARAREGKASRRMSFLV